MTSTFKQRLYARINALIDLLSFNSEIRNLAEILNRRIEHSEGIQRHRPSHPSGFTRGLHKRRLSIAEAYIRILHALDSEQYEERLAALKSLVGQSFHAKTVGLPLNTARVQIDLMKEAVKGGENRRRQLEFLADFTRASYGQESVIRQLLKEQGIIQVPETGLPLKEMDLGWDSHVHDNLSEGRKTPTQVLIDAFIKGVSRLTLTYFDLADERIIREAIEAGQMLGIDVSIGIEFSVGPKGRRRHFMYIPPVCFGEARECVSFFHDNQAVLAAFLAGLKVNAENRRRTISAILDSFNVNHLALLNEGYTDKEYLLLRPLKWDNVQDIVLQGQASRMHLGELLFNKFKPVLHRRVLAAKLQYEVASQRFKEGILSQWEYELMVEQYNKLRKQYEELTPEFLRSTYFEDRSIVDYDSAFTDTGQIFRELAQCKGELAYIHPLEAGLSAAVRTIMEDHAYITRIETINMRDSVKRNPDDLHLLNRFVAMLNQGDTAGVQYFLEEVGITDILAPTVKTACDHYRQRALIPVCGSDSTGRDPKIPGMGFILQGHIPRPLRQHFVKSHALLPPPIAALIASRGQSLELKSTDQNVVSLGKAGHYRKNQVGDELDLVSVSLPNFWRFLNPGVRNLVKTLCGFVPAFLGFHYILHRPPLVAVMYACIWFAITFTRNVIVDLVAGSGLEPKEWEWRHVNLDNATSSLFWTGFSVPLLGLVDNTFRSLYIQFAPMQGITYEAFRFFFLAFFNGTYIATHNRIRNFDPKVIRVNFFRSILSWPFATVFSFAGNLLGLPAVVQAKFWSDFVAGLIEGNGKLGQHMVLRKRDLREILPQLNSTDRNERITAMLDIMYIWAHRQRGETALSRILQGKDFSLKERLAGLFQGAKKPSSPWADAAIMREMRRKLYQMFTEEANIQTFSRFILENFEDKEAVRLMAFVGGNYIKFLDWLRAMPK